MEIKFLKKRKEVVALNRHVAVEQESEAERLLYEAFIKSGARPTRNFMTGGFKIAIAFPAQKIGIEYSEKIPQGEEINPLLATGWNMTRIVSSGALFLWQYNGKAVKYFVDRERAISCLVEALLPRLKTELWNCENFIGIKEDLARKSKTLGR